MAPRPARPHRPDRCTPPPARAALAALAALLLTGTKSYGQEHAHGHADQQLGKVRFPTSCNAAARQAFERAVAMLHSFWFDEAERTFQAAAAADPRCAMAHWGIAMTLWGNPMARANPPAERQQRALEEARRAAELARAAGTSDRERGYIEAVLALYRDFERADHLTRMRRHEEALRALYERHPDDPEAAIFYARMVVANAPPEDLTFARQRLAASILEPLFRAQPEHPGLAHYLIHAYDAPPIARHGLEAARRYAAIAPSAPHALHMPSHIFTRIGYWEESIETNRRSARAEPDSNAAVHPMDYMVYAYLQRGQDGEAARVVARAVALPDRFYGGLNGYNFAAMPARLALEQPASPVVATGASAT